MTMFRYHLNPSDDHSIADALNQAEANGMGVGIEQGKREALEQAQIEINRAFEFGKHCAALGENISVEEAIAFLKSRGYTVFEGKQGGRKRAGGNRNSALTRYETLKYNRVTVAKQRFAPGR